MAKRAAQRDEQNGQQDSQQQASLWQRLTLLLATQCEAWTQRLTVKWRRVARPLGMGVTLLLFLFSATLTSFAQGGTAWYTPVVHAAAALPPGKNTFQQTTDLGKRVIVLPQTKGHTETATQAATPPTPITRPSAITMQPAMIGLSAAVTATASNPQPITWTSSDKRLTVTIPAGAVTPALVAQGNGGVWLHVTQLEGPSGGFGAGASGRISLGTYQFMLYGKHAALHATLAKPITLTLSLKSFKGLRGAGVDLAHVLFVANSSAPVSAFLDPATGKPDPALVNAKPQPYAAALDGTAGTLQVSIPLTASGTTNGTWNTDSPQAHWDAQADTGVDLSGGDLTYSYPLDVPPGPGGLTPRLTLAYDSSSVANEHNPQATSGWLGQGWNLSLGSISWGEHNVTSTCTVQTCPQVCTIQNFYTCTTFENSWQFSDPYGNGGELIPQDSNLSNWYDDTTNAAPTTAEHMDFNLDSNPRVQIVSYTNPKGNSNFPSANYPVQPPCFRAFLPNGYMEEFGCTPDSLQFYVDENLLSGEYKGNYVYRWDLDMIVDPNGNQIQITYSTNTMYRNFSKVNHQIAFPIDAVPNTITYDSPSCHSTTTMCTGSSWQPAVQIVFDTSDAAARLTGNACPTFTNTTTYYTPQTMRCDDVQDLSTQNPKGDAAPALQSLAILNDVQMQVSTNPGAPTPTWNTLRTYNFSYDQAAATQQEDPATGSQESVAGHLVLTQIQQVGDDGTTSLPPLTMTYTPREEYYLDDYYLPKPSTNCGPAWNDSFCHLWAGFVGEYLASMNNGRGRYETYTWALAHNNTHGVNSGLTLEDPLACNGTPYSTAPCNQADDQNWSKIVVTQRQASVRCVRADGTGCGNNGTGSALLSSTYSYTYRLTDVQNYECGNNSCSVDMYWGNQNDGDELDFYNTHFMGFHTTQVTSPDGSQQLYTFNSGDGYGVATSSITCYSGNGCAVAPWTDPANALHGRTSEEDDYDTNGTTLLKKATTSYALTCPPSGIGGSPHNSSNSHAYYVGQRTSELDINNPVVVCEIETGQTVESVYDGGTNHVDTTTTDSYSYNGFYMTSASEDTSASDNSQTPHITQKTQYAWHDGITRTSTSANGPYFDMLAGIQTTEDGSGNVKACSYIAYDGGTAGATGSQSGITAGLATRTDRYATNCTPGSLSGQVSSASAYNANGDLLATEDADALSGVSGHTNGANCTINSVAYTACASYDSLYSALVTQVNNAIPGQATALNYTDDGGNPNNPDASNGWGQWLTTTTDANSQVTAFAYDALGRLTATAQPGATPADTLSSPTTSNTYPVNCPTTTSAEPCYALTTTQKLATGVTYTSATYYDGWGRAVETVAPESTVGSTTTWTVSFTEYDGSGRKSFVSDPYFVTTSSTTPAYHRPDTTQPGTTYYSYDGLGRVTETIDPLGDKTYTSYTIDQPTAGANITDTNEYEVTTTIDANSHKHRELSDGLGHTRYVEQFSGNGGSVPYALYGTSRADYDWLGDTTVTYEPTNYPTAPAAGLGTTAQTTTAYDLLGRASSSTDADLGTVSQRYDANGNVVETVDPRGGSGGTTYLGYDGLNRVLWRNTSNAPTGAYASYTYDQLGLSYGYGTGRLTTATFSNGNVGGNLDGSYTYAYDARGRQTGVTQTLEGTSYPFTTSYNDANQPTSLTYSDNEVLSYGYNPDGWLTSLVTQPSGGAITNLLTNISYSGVGGAAGKPTGASVGNGVYTYSASYDTALRLSSETLLAGSTTVYATTRSYDGVSNVTGVATTLSAGTDSQAFCYDEQNQLTWASSATSSSTPCGGSNSAGSLTSAQYTQAFAYDATGRLTSSPTGTYTYGDSAHVHGVTAIGSSAYSAAYDAAGDMYCRTLNTGIHCPLSPTAQELTYDNERRLTSWQNKPSSPTATDTYLYDGSGSRVEQQSVVSGTTTDTAYLLGGVEEVSGGVVTKYLGVSGLPQAIRVGTSGSLNYLASDGLGSVSEALDGAGNVVAAQLYTPYGQTRYSSGTMPTAKGFTGQRADSVSGLDYYGARYYDPVAQQFTEADSASDGLSRFAYVRGNPETFTDPTGKLRTCGVDCSGGDPNNGPGAGGNHCTSDANCGCYSSSRCGGSGHGGGNNGNNTHGSGSHKPSTNQQAKLQTNGSAGCSPADPSCLGNISQAVAKIALGIAGVITGIGLIIACWQTGTCWLTAKEIGVLLAFSTRQALSGIADYRLLTGTGKVGDIWNVVLRGAIVVVDMVQVILAAMDFSDTFFSEAKDIGDAAQGESEIAQSAEDGSANASNALVSGSQVKASVTALVGLTGFTYILSDTGNFVAALEAYTNL